MGLADVLKSGLDRQRDKREEQQRKQELWLTEVQDTLLQMRQTYDNCLGRPIEGKGTTDTRRLERQLTHHANRLEQLVERSEADNMKDEFIVDIRNLCDQARDLVDTAELDPKFASQPGKKFSQMLESIREQAE